MSQREVSLAVLGTGGRRTRWQMTVAVLRYSTLLLNVFKTLGGWGGQHNVKQLQSYPDFISRSALDIRESFNK